MRKPLTRSSYDRRNSWDESNLFEAHSVTCPPYNAMRRRSHGTTASFDYFSPCLRASVVKSQLFIIDAYAVDLADLDHIHSHFAELRLAVRRLERERVGAHFDDS